MSILTKPTTNPDIERSTKEERPHRRLSLTRPTLPSFNTPTEPTAVALPQAGSTPSTEPATAKTTAKRKRASTTNPTENSAPADSATPVVRVMAYLSVTEAALLDDLWMQYRRSTQKYSKSDILRAALMMASDYADELTVMLSQQQTNTLSRQRVSKMKNTDDNS